MPEPERIYDIDSEYRVPDLTPAIPPGGHVTELPTSTLRTTYYDTADLRLTRSGAMLRHRRGDDGPPWTLTLPSGPPAHIRREATARGISGRGISGRIPEELSRLALGYTRGASVSPVASLRVTRHRYQVVGTAGIPLAVLAAETVTVHAGKRPVSTYRQLVLTHLAGDPDLLNRIEKLVVAAGATEGGHLPEQVRALGPLAAQPPDLPPAQPVGTDPLAADLLIEELRRQVADLITADSAVRFAPEDPAAVETLRLACRRLRTDLRVFSPLFVGEGPHLVEPLRDLAGAVRGVVGPRTRRARLEAIDVAGFDAKAAARLTETLATLEGRAVDALRRHLVSDAYLRMLDDLVATARAPRLGDPAQAVASQILPVLAATFWERLAAAVDRLGRPHDTADWRVARREARRLRRLTQLAVPVVGAPARRLADALDPVIAMLDVVREAHRGVAGWQEASDAAPYDRLLAITVGRLVEREYVLAAAAREGFAEVWGETDWRAATEWLV